MFRNRRRIKGLFGKDILHGMAHITGGRIAGNLCRIVSNGLSTKIDVSKIRILNLFKYIRNSGNISEEEMLRTFNCGVGFIVVISQKEKAFVMKHIRQFYDCYEIGQMEKGGESFKFCVNSKNRYKICE